MYTDTRYRGEMQGLVLQLRLMALGLLILEQNVLWTIFPSAFLLQPNLVYCFPADKTTEVTTKWLLPGQPQLTTVMITTSSDLLHRAWSSVTISSGPTRRGWCLPVRGLTPVRTTDDSGWCTCMTLSPWTHHGNGPYKQQKQTMVLLVRPTKLCVSDYPVLLHWPWAVLHTSAVLWSELTVGCLCWYTPMPHPSRSPLGILGAHFHY